MLHSADAERKHKMVGRTSGFARRFMLARLNQPFGPSDGPVCARVCFAASVVIFEGHGQLARLHSRQKERHSRLEVVTYGAD